MTGLFEPRDAAAVARLIDDFPLGWIIADARPELAQPMPLLADRDAAGAPVSLLGHLPKRHPLVAALREQPAATMLFTGPHGYISPALVDEESWAPTWNFAVAVTSAEVAFDDALTDEALTRLVRHMERSRPRPWSIDKMGERYAQLRARVIGFRASITAIRPRFKLGQDEKDSDFATIVERLSDPVLAQWMLEAR